MASEELSHGENRSEGKYKYKLECHSLVEDPEFPQTNCIPRELRKTLSRLFSLGQVTGKEKGGGAQRSVC